ncbi:MAG: CbiQ family ECF transporter T component, partial [Clostridia bacterium]|nr:CbiQ family ECF transporter T component [Clostridia bacterium]
MFRDVTLGQYYPADSFVHRMDPRIKILLNILYLVGIFFIKSYFGFVIVLLFLCVAILFSKVPVGSVIRSVKGILVLVAITGLLNVFFYTGETVLWSWWIIVITKEA